MAEGGDKRKTSEAPPSYSDSIKNIGEQAPKLVSIVQDSIKQVTESLEKVKKLIGESVDVSSPEVSMRLEELRTFLGNVVLKGRSYCKGCKDLGEYASDQDLIGEICTDLDNGNLTELKDFLVEIDEYLKVCETRFERVDKASSTAKKETREAGGKFEELKNNAVDKLRKEHIAVGVLATAGGGAQGGGAMLSFLSPQAGLLTMFVGIGSQVAAAGLLIDAGYTEKQAKIFAKACKVTIDLDKDLGKVMHIVDDMRSQISDIKESASGIDRLKAKTADAERKQLEEDKVLKEEDYVQTSFCCFGAPRHGGLARKKKGKRDELSKKHLKKLQTPVKRLSDKMKELKVESAKLINEISNVKVYN